MGVRHLAVATIIFLVSFQASGADIRPELDQCRSIPSLALRLQCYDRLVDGLQSSGLSTVIPEPVITNTPSSSSVSVPVPVRPNVAAVATQTVIEKPEVAAEDLFGKSAKQVEETVSRELKIDSVDQISSEVTRVRINAAKEYVVYLANGQIWRQKDKVGKWRIKVGETAIISKAALGSFRMKSSARKKSVLAERLR